MLKFVLILMISCFSFAQNTAIKRASLSTSVADAHTIQKGHYKVQQSVGHMGIMTRAKRLMTEGNNYELRIR